MDAVTVTVNVIPGINVIQLVDLDDGNFILLRRNECTAFLAEFMDAMAASIPDSAPGDAGMPSADAPERVGPLAVAGVENNVIDMQRWSWRVDGAAS